MLVFWCLMLKLLVIGLARRAPPSVGGGLKTPGGGHRRPPSLREIVVEVRCWSKMKGQLELPTGTAQLWRQVRNQFPQFPCQEGQNLEKFVPGPSEIESGAAKIEPGALQVAIFKRPLT